MPKEKGATFCYLCQKPLMFAQLFMHNEMAMWCNDPECPRFGLLTVVSIPVGKTDEEKDKES
jgi:hypothetical protein